MPTIQDILQLLENTGHSPAVLRGTDGQKVVVVVPSLAGRVLCTGSAGLVGPTDSYILEDQIRKGPIQTGPGVIWNNVGGEERIWLGPEGGPHALFFSPGAAQRIENYWIPSALDLAPFQVTDVHRNGQYVTISAPASLNNYAGTHFDLEITRRIEILDDCPFSAGAYPEFAFTGFESRTWVRNTGTQAWTRDSGALSIWTIGQFPGRRQTVVLLPFQPGAEAELGPPISMDDYLRMFYPEHPPRREEIGRLGEHCFQFRANGDVMAKAELPTRRCLGRIASLDPDRLEMRIVQASVYPTLDYACSFVLPTTADPYSGGAMSSFSAARNLDEQSYYELESLSPALFLGPGETFCHVSRTYHLRGDEQTIMEICRRHFFTTPSDLEDFERQRSRVTASC